MRASLKILAVYPELTLALIRRVRSPFSVLAERGHSFHFLHSDSFSGALAHAYDVTVLSDWVLSDEQDYQSFRQARAQGREIVCDLSDGRLLSEARMREQLALCSLVTVSTERLKKEVQNLIGATRVAVLPSCVDLPYFASANRLARPVRPIIGCFGEGDWGAIAPTLKAFHEKHPRVQFLGTPEVAEAVNSQELLIQPVALHPENYPVLLHACIFGLLPPESAWGRDPIWQWEYGILCRPTLILSPAVTATTPAPSQRSMEDIVTSQVARIEKMRGNARLCAECGHASFMEATDHRATRGADLYYRMYQRHFAHLFSS